MSRRAKSFTHRPLEKADFSSLVDPRVWRPPSVLTVPVGLSSEVWREEEGRKCVVA